MEEFISNAALLAGHLTQQCDKSIADQKAATSELQRAAQDVGKGVVAGRAELTQSARSAVREALSQEIPAAVDALTETGDRLRRLADQLQREQGAAASHIRMLAWKSLAAMVLASAVIIGGTAYAAWTNVQRAQQGKVEAQVMEALQQVSITSCDGTPCVKLQDGQRRWPKNDDYFLIDGGAPAPVAD